MRPEEFDEVVQRYLRGISTPQEKRLVEDWFKSLTNENEELIAESSKQISRQRILSKLNAQIGAQPPQGRRKTYRRILRYAASFTLLALAVYYLSGLNFSEQNGINGRQESISSAYSHVVNETASEQKIFLKDGSCVLLEPGSELSYPENFHDNREVHLKGEAFFQVTSDKKHPFYVYAGNVITHVVGTSFRVNAADDKGKITVSVKTGKVSVYSKEPSEYSTKKTRELMLSPNQEAVYDPVKEELSQRIIDKPQVIPNMPDVKMKFENTPAPRIFDALEKAYGIDLQFNRDALAECTLTTDLSEEGFYQRIEALCHALNAEYHVTEASVIIESKGCNYSND
jgi:ferric-dicitrate binding protein FerR (iron transport regulator)